MKLRNHNQPSNPNNYCRQYYTGCGIELTDRFGDKFVGQVTLVDPDHLEAIMVQEPPPEDDEREIICMRIQWVTADFLGCEHKRISKQKYLLYKLKGWNLP